MFGVRISCIKFSVTCLDWSCRAQVVDIWGQMGKVSRLLEEQLMSMYVLVVNSVNRMAFGKIPQFVANTFFSPIWVNNLYYPIWKDFFKKALGCSYIQMGTKNSVNLKNCHPKNVGGGGL